MLDAHFHLSVAPLATGILATSREDEWDAAFSLSQKGIIPSLGILPPERGDFARMEDLLRKREDLAVGEVGLDKRFADKEDQIRNLSRAQTLARTLGRPLTLHVVGYDGLALKLIDPRVPTLWHGFTGSVESAREIVRKHGVLSLGPRCEHTRLWKNLEALRDMPFAVESDATTTQDYARLLELWYQRLASRLDWSIAKLEDHARASLELLFR